MLKIDFLKESKFWGTCNEKNKLFALCCSSKVVIKIWRAWGKLAFAYFYATMISNASPLEQFCRLNAQIKAISVTNVR